MTAGSLPVHLDDVEITVAVPGGDTYTLPIGPRRLTAGPLRGDDPPSPASLTNALGLVQDHLDDLLIEAPTIAAAPGVTVAGPHAEAMARVEIGAASIPDDYELARADADEVFRTLALEPVADRRHNPGLAEEYVESIIGTCCVILGIMRRLELSSVRVAVGTQPSATGTE
jgi:exopolyphosphatase/guanosine-5'-triphosphate,3'-diphosphate pyrophosphatase